MFELHVTSDDYTVVCSMPTTVIPRIGDTLTMRDFTGRSAEYLITGPARISIRETDDTGLVTETYVTVPGQLR